MWLDGVTECNWSAAVQYPLNYPLTKSGGNLADLFTLGNDVDAKLKLPICYSDHRLYKLETWPKLWDYFAFLSIQAKNDYLKFAACGVGLLKNVWKLNVIDNISKSHQIL